jgi:hypothetical protein
MAGAHAALHDEDPGAWKLPKERVGGCAAIRRLRAANRQIQHNAEYARVLKMRPAVFP